MSPKVYLNNTHATSGTDLNDIMMMEWEYEMPLLLQPLLISGAFIKNGILYYDAKPGIENLKRFYHFLDATKSVISDKNAFTVYKEKLFSYLDNLEHPYFALNAREVFDTDKLPQDEQAVIWQADIAFNNAVINAAVDKHDISALSYPVLKHVSMAFNSFTELLNYPDYQYGWRYICQVVKREEIYCENGLWGLKGPAGEILIHPQFDEFYAFSAWDVAVVRKGQQYGYVHRSGDIIVPAEWDEAYDFDHAPLAIVQRNELLGLIHISGKVVAEPVYENIRSVRHDNPYIAQRNGRWGMLGEDGQVVIDFRYDRIELLHDNVIMLQQEGGYYLAADGERFDLIIRKAPHQGFAWAFKGNAVYLIDKYGISRANRDLVKQDAESDSSGYYYDEAVRNRLLTYAALPEEEIVTDAYTPVEELYNIGVDAYNRQDYQSAIDHYTLAAERGYGYAMNNLAHIHYMIDGYVDPDKAFYWYEKGAAAGNTNAINGLSLCYQNGIGTAPDIDKAIELLLLAADDGLAVAHNNLGYLLYDTNPELALFHYLRAEELGEPDYSWLGHLYEENGDLATALRYYQKDETATGAFNQGIFYLKGLGIAKDVNAAVRYFKRATEGGYDMGHIELARIYLFEDGFINSELAKAHIAAAERAGIEIPAEFLI
ncbi:SEL1-like repeat protein [Chitinophaga agri]|uniref:SEL1-like repeat protein n=1 Tax=Chitinophaga agri TaxID=2703787 RepID=A0A6B9ZA39_9BACT|nr:SEL1-like repeat protein [Chitinophaga agri]QHS59128.1 SEL1-like repeat protein [Chitinophaga agri]